jgi:hypothetical protein
MPGTQAMAVAAVFALVGFLPLAGRRLLRVLVWICLAAGVGVGLLARDGVQIILEWLSPYLGPASAPQGAILSLLVASAVGELLKATPALAAVALAPADALDGLAYGAAVGAGFGFMVTLQVLGMALALIGSPLTSPLSVGLAIAGWFFRILAHVATTAFVGRAGIRGGVVTALLVACIVQFVLAMAERLPYVGVIPMGTVVTIVISLGFFLYLWSVRAQTA